MTGWQSLYGADGLYRDHDMYYFDKNGSLSTGVKMIGNTTIIFAKVDRWIMEPIIQREITRDGIVTTERNVISDCLMMKIMHIWMSAERKLEVKPIILTKMGIN